MTALPCVAPCHVPVSWGTAFLVAAGAAAMVYGLYCGALLYARSLARGAPGEQARPAALAHHVEFWRQLGALVYDGCHLMAATARISEAGEPARLRQPLAPDPAPATRSSAERQWRRFFEPAATGRRTALHEAAMTGDAAALRARLRDATGVAIGRRVI